MRDPEKKGGIRVYSLMFGGFLGGEDVPPKH